MKQQDYDSSFINESLPAFVSEAQEHLQMIEQLLLQLESDPGNRELLDALFRSAHTIKGSAGIFGLTDVVSFTHHVEALLEQLRSGQRNVDAELGTLLLQCTDQIRLLVDGIGRGSADVGDHHESRATLVNKLQAVLGHLPSSSAATPATEHSSAADHSQGWHVRVAFGPDTFRGGMDPLAILRYLGEQTQISQMRCHTTAIPLMSALDPEACHLVFDMDLQGEIERAQIEAAFHFVMEDCELSCQPLASPTSALADTTDDDTSGDAAIVANSNATRPASGQHAPHIRVRADRLDQVIQLLGELVIASSGATMLARQHGRSDLMEVNQQIADLVEEIRNGALQLRMVQIGDTFTRFRRVVRDMAAELGKDIALNISGADTELDKSVVEQIIDPLTHLVRNALDHGLETPEQRRAAGKPTQGQLSLSACHDSGSIVIRIVDDGRGIHRDKVLARAIERGLVSAEAVLSDSDVINLIFAPGFSTAEKVTNLSGRGVGMDVVRSNIEALRGTVTVTSDAGRGTHIEIRLPLTLAIIDGFLVSVGQSKFIFPLDNVFEVIESSAEESALARGITELRGHLLPVADLRRIYDIDAGFSKRNSIVVIKSGQQRYGVRVDALLGRHQTVIKPLARIFKGLKGISGSTILGNGEVALICDPASLGELACLDQQISSTHEAA